LVEKNVYEPILIKLNQQLIDNKVRIVKGKAFKEARLTKI